MMAASTSLASAPRLQRPSIVTRGPSRNTTVSVTALFSKKPKPAPEPVKETTKGVKTKKAEPAPEPKKKTNAVFSVLNDLDFTSTRSASDRDLLYEAKYGKKGDDGKMTPEQYQALRRKVIGTAKDYWKDWVEEEQVKNIKTYYKPDAAGGSVPYLPLLVGVVVAMLVTTVLVVQKTS